jgi:hypothetical protein
MVGESAYRRTLLSFIPSCISCYLNVFVIQRSNLFKLPPLTKFVRVLFYTYK